MIVTRLDAQTTALPQGVAAGEVQPAMPSVEDDAGVVDLTQEVQGDGGASVNIESKINSKMNLKIIRKLNRSRKNLYEICINLQWPLAIGTSTF